ncbi:MAG: hypothetical protein JO026_02940 [Patescibacteria group bacterium]|nr:hypothetical protein [Patescibacteria group bacterium]
MNATAEKMRISAESAEELLFPDGTRVTGRYLDSLPINRKPSATSLHEARHAFAAYLLGIDVYYLTNIPEGNSLGHTLLAGFHPVVAAAPDALGSPGGSSDLRKVDASGHSIEGARAEARELLAGYEEEIFALATALDMRNTLGGSEMVAIAREIDAEKKEGKWMLITITSPDGKTETLKQRGKSNIEVPLHIPQEVLPEPPFDEAQWGEFRKSASELRERRAEA